MSDISARRIGLGCRYCHTLLWIWVGRGLPALATLQLFKVLPHLLQACLVSHQRRIVRDDKTHERRGPQTHFADPADRSRLLVLGHDDTALMQKRRGLSVQGRSKSLR